MTAPQLPAWYTIPRTETGVNVRNTGKHPEWNSPPFSDLFTEAVPTVVDMVHDTLTNFTEMSKGLVHTGIGWLEAFFNLQLGWLEDFIDGLIDAWVAVFDLTNWETFVTTLVDWVIESFFPWIPETATGPKGGTLHPRDDIHTIARFPFHLLEIQAWINFLGAAWNFFVWLGTAVDTLWDDFLDWAISSLLPWIPEDATGPKGGTLHPKADLKTVLRWPFHLLEIQSWLDGLTATYNLLIWAATEVDELWDQFVEWCIDTFLPWLPAAQHAQLKNVLRWPFHLIDLQAWLDMFTGVWGLCSWAATVVDGLWDDSLDWLLTTLLPDNTTTGMNATIRGYLKTLLRLPFHLVEVSAWTDALNSLFNLIGWFSARLAGQAGAFWDALIGWVAQFASGLFDWIAYPILFLFGKNPTPTVNGAAWTPTHTLLDMARGSSTPQASFTAILSSLLGDIGQDIADAVTAIEDAAAWLFFTIFPSLRRASQYTRAWDDMLARFQDPGSGVFTVAVDLVEGLTDMITDATNAFANGIATVIGVPAGWHPQDAPIDRVISYIMDKMFDWIAYPILFLFGKSVSEGSTATQTLLSMINGSSTPSNQFVSIAAGLISGLEDAVTPIINAVVTVANSVIADIGDLVVKFFKHIFATPNDRLTTFPALKTSWQKFWDDVLPTGTTGVSGRDPTGIASKIVDAFASFLMPISDSGEHASNVIEAFFNLLLWQGADPLGDFLNALSDLFGAVKPTPGSAAATLPNPGTGPQIAWRLFTNLINVPGNPGVPVLDAVTGLLSPVKVQGLPELTAQNSQAVANIADLQDQNQQAQTNIVRLTNENVEARSNIKALQSENAEAQSNITELQGQNREATANITQLQTDNTTAKQNISQLQSQNATAAQNITDLTSRIDHAENQTIPALQEGVDHANTALDSLHAAIVAGVGGPQSAQADEIDRNGYSDLINAGLALQSIAQAGQALGLNSSRTLARRDNKPLYAGMDATGVVPFDLPMLGDQAPVKTLLPGDYQCDFIRAGEDSQVNRVSWVGHGVNLTGFYLVVVGMDTHGNATKLYESPNLVGQPGFGTSPTANEWCQHNVPNTLVLKTSGVYGVGFRITGGSGAAYELVGYDCWLDDHPDVVPRTPGMKLSASGGERGYAEDSSVSSTLDEFTIKSSTKIVAAGENRVILTDAPDSAAVVMLTDAGEVANTQVITADAGAPLLQVFADSYGAMYQVLDTPARTVHRVTMDKTITSMDAAAADPNGVVYPSATLYPSTSLYPTAPASRDNFSVGGLAATPDGRVLVYDNDTRQLLSLDFNTGDVTQTPFDVSLNSVIALTLDASDQCLLMLNTSTAEIVRTPLGNNGVTTYIPLSLPSGTMLTGLTPGDDDGHALVSLRTAASVDTTARIDLTTGAIDYLSTTPAVVPTAVTSLVPATAVASVNGPDVAALTNGQLVVHKNVHAYDVPDSQLVSRQPLPWWSLSMYTDGKPLPRYDAAIIHPDELVQIGLDPFVIPAWVNTIFLVGIGGGGGGGGYIAGTNEGYGGYGGKLASIAAYRGPHFQPGDNLWAALGKGGDGGIPGAATGGDATNGQTGGNSVINLSRTLTALIAQGGNGGDGATSTHKSERNVPSTQPAPDIRNSSWGHAAAESNKALVRNGVWVFDDRAQTIVVAGQSISVGGAAMRIRGSGPGGGGSGAIHAPGEAGYGYPGATGGAWAVLSQRIIANA